LKENSTHEFTTAGADPGRVDWVASHPSPGSFKLEIRKGNNTITEAIFVSNGSDITQSGQQPPFPLPPIKNPGSDTGQAGARLQCMQSCYLEPPGDLGKGSR